MILHWTYDTEVEQARRRSTLYDYSCILYPTYEHPEQPSQKPDRTGVLIAYLYFTLLGAISQE